jgi:tetratricopeptide (TPR) repeat protein
MRSTFEVRADGFLSYTHLDDTEGYVEKLCARLAAEISKHLGREFRIFSDHDLLWGAAWRDAIEASASNATCFFPIVSPRFFASPECRRELERFLEHESRIQRHDLIFPLRLLDVPDFSETCSDPLKRLVASRQHRDWTQLRHENLGSKKVKQAIAELARNVRDVLQFPALANSTVASPIFGLQAHPSLEDLLSHIAAHRADPLSTQQVDELILLARSTIETSPRAVARLFKVLDKRIKSIGNKKLVLTAAELAISAAKLAVRDEDVAKWEAHALICGVSWVYQRIGRLDDARAKADQSFSIGESIGDDENSAFCKKCSGRLARMQAERVADQSMRVRLLNESVGLLQDAITRFSRLGNHGPASPEVGDCRSLLARTLLSMQRPDDAFAEAVRAYRLLQPGSKDFIDLLILNGDIDVARKSKGSARNWYSEAIGAKAVAGAEINEMRARAYCQRARLLPSNEDERRIALEDYRRSAAIWTELGETRAAATAQWESALLEGDVPRNAIRKLARQDPCVRIRVLAQHQAEVAGSSRPAVGRRQEPAPEYWDWQIKEAVRLLAIEEQQW